MGNESLRWATCRAANFYISLLLPFMEYFKIGKIVATHGVAGKMIVQHSLQKRTGWSKTEAIFLEEGKDNFLPWFLQSVAVQTNDKILIGLEGVDSREAAHKLLKKEVWLNENDFARLASPYSPIALLGYEIREEDKSLGEVIEVVEQPHQTLCKIIIDNKEVWIPIHEGSLVKTDRRKRIIYVKLPDGLLDIYLQ